jgi:hypothetical protein
MKRSVARALSLFGRLAVIGLAAATGGLGLPAPAGAQQQGAQQQQAAPPAQQQEQPLGLRPGQDPFSVPAKNALPRQQSAAPFGAQPQQQALPQQAFPQRTAPQQQAAPQQAAPQQGAPQQAVQNPFAVPAQNAAPQEGANAGCDKLVTLLTARRDMMTKINESAKKHQKMDAPTACGLFTKLSANGNEAIKWMSANKEWCRIPDQFITSVKNDNEKVTTIRGQACKVAEQIEHAKKNGGQGGLMGGSGLSGEMKIPSGAL